MWILQTSFGYHFTHHDSALINVCAYNRLALQWCATTAPLKLASSDSRKQWRKSWHRPVSESMLYYQVKISFIGKCVLFSLFAISRCQGRAHQHELGFATCMSTINIHGEVLEIIFHHIFWFACTRKKKRGPYRVDARFSFVVHVSMRDVILLPSGAIDTPILHHAPEDVLKQIVHETPLGRSGKPEGFSLVIFLPLLHWMTYVILKVSHIFACIHTT